MTVLTKKQLFRAEQLSSIDLAQLPKHIAIIPDGNRRWASLHNFSPLDGHRKGCNNVLDIVLAAKEIGINTITCYAFSTENWQRPPSEIESIMNLLISYLDVETQNMVENGIKFETIGSLDKLREDVQERIALTKEETKDCAKINFIMAINYGGRDEICRVAQKLIHDNPKHVTEELFASYLDTTKWGDPHLLIRTSGEYRVSNFLIWQLSYTEIYLTSILWPDFKPHHLLESIQWYQQREKRKGK